MHREFDFYELVLKELKKIKTSRRPISFPLIFYRLGAIFHFDKKTSMQVLKEMEKKRLVKIHSFHGVEILPKNS
jgi:hypothetical protein